MSGRGWRSLLILVAICCLTVSLATRFCVQTTTAHTTKSIERRSVDPKQQHLDRDASQWVETTATLGIFEPVVVSKRLVITRKTLPNPVFSESLYNRPPPASAFLA